MKSQNHNTSILSTHQHQRILILTHNLMQTNSTFMLTQNTP